MYVYRTHAAYTAMEYTSFMCGRSARRDTNEATKFLKLSHIRRFYSRLWHADVAEASEEAVEASEEGEGDSGVLRPRRGTR